MTLFRGNRGVGIAFLGIFIFLICLFGAKKAECLYEIKKCEKLYEKMRETASTQNKKEIIR